MNNQKHNKRTEDDEHKAIAIGSSKFNQSRRIERWSRQLENYDQSAPLQHSSGTLIDPEASDMPDKSLRAPLLDGGQGENYYAKCALVEPRGDINASARPNNNKPSNVPHSGNLMHPMVGAMSPTRCPAFQTGSKKRRHPSCQHPGPTQVAKG